MAYAVQPTKLTQDLGCCMIALASSFTATRFGICIAKRRFWIVEDVTVALAWACFTAMSIGYICVTPAVYRIAAVGNGEVPPYATLKDDSEYLVKIFFPNTLLLWTTLWLVKFALLLRCRRLIDRRHLYTVVWRCILAFTVVAYVGCIVSEFTSCRSLWFPLVCGSRTTNTMPSCLLTKCLGMCQTERDAKASVISLFYAFAVDIITDMMSEYFASQNVTSPVVLTRNLVMILPLQILWRLQLSPMRKYSIMAIFGVGTICIITSIIRVVQIRSQSGSKQPSPSWLELWAMVEAAVGKHYLPTTALNS